MLLINAVAGSGKSTLLKGISKSNPDNRILFLAFNKAIQSHFDSWKLPNVEARTINAYSLDIISRRLDIDEINFDRYNDSVRIALGKHKYTNYNINIVNRVVGLYINLAYIFDESVSVRRHIHNIVTDSNINISKWNASDFYSVCERVIANLKNASECLTHDHCVYLAVKEIKENPWQTIYDKILIDEFQDLSPLNLMFLDCLIASGRSSIILTGDTGQGIYAFRGASLSVMTDIVVKYNPVIADLTYCFRCTEQVCELATKYRKMPVRSYKKDSSRLYYVEENKVAEEMYNRFKDPSIKTLSILHRENEPLIEILTHLLNLNVPCIISDLERLNNIFKYECPARTAMLQFCDKNSIAPNSGAYQHYITTVSKHVLLSTIHSAKGMEFDYVCCFWPPNKKGMPAVDLIQLDNLRYVMITRTKKDLGVVIQKENNGN